MALPATIGLGQRLAVDDGDHLLDPGLDASVVVSQLEVRGNRLIDDPVRGRIGQRALESVADFDAHAAVILRDQEDRTVVHALAAELPLICHPDAVLLDLLGMRRGHDEHHDLAALVRLEGGELALDAIYGVPRQDAGEIDDARTEWRHGDEGLRERETCRKA